MECGNIVTILFKSPSAEKSDHGHGWLLCARSKRPGSRCTAENRDELAPPHCLPRGSGQGIVPAQTCMGKDLANVRFGPKADIKIYSKPALRMPSRNFSIGPAVYGTYCLIHAIDITGNNSLTRARASRASWI